MQAKVNHIYIFLFHLFPLSAIDLSIYLVDLIRLVLIPPRIFLLVLIEYKITFRTITGIGCSRSVAAQRIPPLSPRMVTTQRMSPVVCLLRASHWWYPSCGCLLVNPGNWRIPGVSGSPLGCVARTFWYQPVYASRKKLCRGFSYTGPVRVLSMLFLHI